MTIMQDPPKVEVEFDQARYDAGNYDGVIEVMNGSGDMKIMWDRNNPHEVASAKAAFDEARRNRMLIHTVTGKKGKPDEVFTGDFNPETERLIARPQLVGG